MSKRILLLNGIEVHGEDSVDRLAPALEDAGYQVIDVRLNKIRWWQGRFDRHCRENLTRIANEQEDGDHVIAHSNGVATQYQSMMGGLKYGKVFWLGGALGCKVDLPEDRFEMLYNFFNPHDRALFWGMLRPFHIWGGVGRLDYRGATIRKVQSKLVYGRSRNGHGHYFWPPCQAEVEAFILKKLAEVG